jgi:predicted RNase H-like nuclease (RuvC/YqgF family)
MSDFGLGGAWLLSEQLAMYRRLDAKNRAQDQSVLHSNDIAWRHQYNDLVNRYNCLLDDVNKYARLCDETVETQAGTIADLKAANDALRAEKEQLRSRLVDVEGELAVLRGLDRELHPEAYIYR